jgi:tRNA pseudouridine32 synthase/23S rRNA pseudouridine746 synthase
MAKRKQQQHTFIREPKYPTTTSNNDKSIEIKGRQKNYSTTMKIPFLFKSRDIIIIDKPFDVHIDGGLPVTIEKLMNQQHSDMLERAQHEERRKFKFCHQLDYSTSGVLALAVTKKACAHVATCFQFRTAQKIYIAVVLGHIEEPEKQPMYIKSMIGEDPDDLRGFRMCSVDEKNNSAIQRTNAKLGETNCTILKRGYYKQKVKSDDSEEITEKEIPVTKVMLQPKSGRRHQLRLHMKDIGHPICGDATYAEDMISHRMMLHAWRLTLPIDLQTEEIERPKKYKKTNTSKKVETTPSSTFEAPDPFEGDLYRWI